MKVVILLLCLGLLPAHCDYWNTASVLQPPSIKFVSLLNPPSYDNTTCAGRCCKRVEVARAPDEECKADWKACAQLSRDSTAERCGGGLFPCTAWVPCEDERQAVSGGLLAFIVLTSIVCFYLVMNCVKNSIFCSNVPYYQKTFFKARMVFDFSMFFALVICGVFFGCSIVIASEYEHFAETTEVKLDFVSYQHCVEFCNHYIPWDTDSIGDKLNTYQKFYCRDAAYNLSGFDIFPADHNQRPGSSECPTSWTLGIGGSFEGWYCSSCFERRDDWGHLRAVSEFNRIRGYVLWSLLLCAAYISVLMDLAERFQAYSVCIGLLNCSTFLLVFGALGHFVCFIMDCMFLYRLDIYPGAKLTSSTVNKYDAYGFYATSIFVDMVGFLAMLGLAAAYGEAGKYLFNEEKRQRYEEYERLSRRDDAGVVRIERGDVKSGVGSTVSRQ